MLQFEKLTSDNILEIKPFLEKIDYSITDNSIGCLFMWRKTNNTMYTIYKDCLIVRENYDSDTVGFKYPVSLSGDLEAEQQAISQIERYAQEKQISLNFCKLDENRLNSLVGRYKDRICIKNTRYWRDYIYNAEDLKAFKGKKFSGQRNHINKFKRNYPDYTFNVFKKGDEDKVCEFLKEYSKSFNKSDIIAVEELKRTKELVDFIDKLGLLCGYIELGGKVISLSIGEIFNDTLIIHCEKALVKYEGIYPLTVSEFATNFASNEVKFLNREDDAGDLGLRRSKMQYKPIKLADKFFIGIKRSIDELEKIPTVLSERLTLKEIEYSDKKEYNELSLDDELNKYWGYDYKKDLKGEFYDNYFVDVTKHDFSKKSVINLGIYKCGKLIGEIVMQYFDYFSGMEIGVRILNKYFGKGYGRESLIAASNWAMNTLNIEKVFAKCYKENIPSKNMLIKSGMRQTAEDETFFYFLKEN